MVRTLHDMQRGAGAEMIAHGTHEVQCCEGVAGPLEEQHRDRDPVEMGSAGGAGAPRRVEGEAEEHETTHAVEFNLRLIAQVRFAKKPRGNIKRRGDMTSDEGELLAAHSLFSRLTPEQRRVVFASMSRLIACLNAPKYRAAAAPSMPSSS